MLGDVGADDDVAAVRADALQVGDAAEVDEMRRRGEPELHHGNEAVAAAERARVLAEIGKQRDGFVDGFRAVVGECAWNHGFLRSGLAPTDLRPAALAAHLSEWSGCRGDLLTCCGAATIGAFTSRGRPARNAACPARTASGKLTLVARIAGIPRNQLVSRREVRQPACCSANERFSETASRGPRPSCDFSPPKRLRLTGTV